jgi:protein-S-isoprenylcysteine O-methyltransferase Ste14
MDVASRLTVSLLHELRVGDAALDRLLADRLLPALLFGALGFVSYSSTLSASSQGPADPSFPARLVHAPDVVHTILTLLFCGLIATLFLIRRTPQGSPAGARAIALALAGTFVMSATVIQPNTTQDWRVLGIGDALLTVGLAFSIYAAASLRDCFGLAAEARGVVGSGAYRLVRHPIYLGEFVAALGALLPVLAPLTTLIFGVFCLCQVARAMLEERVLAASFPEYVLYQRRTPAFFPWPRSRTSMSPGLLRSREDEEGALAPDMAKTNRVMTKLIRRSVPQPIMRGPRPELQKIMLAPPPSSESARYPMHDADHHAPQ